MDRNFETFYVNWFSRVTKFAQTYVMDEEEAKNIAQDVFLRLLERWDSLADNLDVTGYLFIAVKNECLKTLRKKLERERMANEMRERWRLEAQLHYDALSAMDTNFRDEADIERRLREAVAKLPERCRQIFTMSKLQGKRQADIARELKISENTVETQMGIAYRKLRQELSDCLPLLLFVFYPPPFD